MTLRRYVTIEKQVGETPLSAMEAWRAAQPPAYQHLPLAYAGRLDPMASGTLLILIGEECKAQQQYHTLDKRYEFSVLFGVASDTADVLGRLTTTPLPPTLPPAQLRQATRALTGTISLPYPHFSAKTVQGKPLHTWTLEGRLHEITIPTNTTTIYRLQCRSTETLSRQHIAAAAIEKIHRIPTVTDPRKALGNDFRRVDITHDWETFSQSGLPTDQFTVAHFVCIASSGSYMRSLAGALGTALAVPALAWRIHRTTIGRYYPLCSGFGFWTKRF